MNIIKVHSNLRLVDKIEEIGHDDDNIDWSSDEESDRGVNMPILSYIRHLRTAECYRIPETFELSRIFLNFIISRTFTNFSEL